MVQTGELALSALDRTIADWFPAKVGRAVEAFMRAPEGRKAA
jgi:hypothetical protein